MEGSARISPEVLASYAADAAQAVKGVRRLADGHLPGRRGVRITVDEGSVSVELHLAVDWGASIPEVGRAVQERVADYLERMADVRPAAVDVVVDGIVG
jgi:uncharacterized alkaline shock family protein YloU